MHQLRDEGGRELVRRHEEAERSVGQGDLELCRRPAVREGQREPGSELPDRAPGQGARLLPARCRRP